MLDVLVVGSGPLGVALAGRVSRAGMSVLVLEQGPAGTSPPGSHLRNAEPYQSDPDAFLQEAVRRCHFFDPQAPEAGLPGASTSALVGGQGALWTNNCPRIPEFQRWAPPDPDEWVRLDEQAEQVLGVVEDPFAGSLRQQAVRERLAPALREQKREVLPQRMAGHALPGGKVRETSWPGSRSAPAAGSSRWCIRGAGCEGGVRPGGDPGRAGGAGRGRLRHACSAVALGNPSPRAGTRPELSAGAHGPVRARPAAVPPPAPTCRPACASPPPRAIPGIRWCCAT